MSDHDPAVEPAVRGMLATHAQDAPDGAGLYAAVLAQRRRDRQRRLAIVSLIVVLLLVAGTALAVARHSARLVPTDRPTPSASANGGSAPPSPVGVGWLPEGFSKPQANYALSLANDTPAWTITTQRAKPQAELAITVSPTKIAVRHGAGTLRTISLNGTPATLYTVPPHEPGVAPYGSVPPEADGPLIDLTYARRPGQWIQIEAHIAAGNVDMGLSEQDIRKIAAGLNDHGLATSDLIRLAYVPPGLTVTTSSMSSSESQLYLDPAGTPAPVYSKDPANPRRTSSAVQIDLSNDTPFLEAISGVGQFGTVIGTFESGGRKVRLSRVRAEGGGWHRVALIEPAGGPGVVVWVRASYPLADADIVRLAAGVQPGRDYPR